MNSRPKCADRDDVSRRRFLGTAAVAVASSATLSQLCLGDETPLLTMPIGASRSRVVQVRSTHVVRGTVVHKSIFDEMLDVTLSQLMGTTSSQAAWHKLLKPDDVVGLKFNRSAQEVLATADTVADTLIRSLVDAGWPTSQIVCIEAPPSIAKQYDLMPMRAGYASDSTSFASGSDQFASVLSQITALISIPFLKTHNIAGLTGALKNLSHGLVKHPARFHSNGCSPFIPDIVAAPVIQSKIRLCLMDALRIVFDGGPDATADSISDSGILLASVDPVAIDSVGLLKINAVREQKGLSKLAIDPGAVPYIAAAHKQGLGIGAWHGIELAEIRV